MRNNIQNVLAKNLVKLTKYSIHADKIALAVSGGVDSVAMLILMSNWAKDNNVQLIVMTVNHNVRVESESECSYVKELSNRLGHSCYILNWYPNWSKNFQEQAREGRYKLMTDLCTELGIEILLTAHHFNDTVDHFFLKQPISSTNMVHSTNNTRYVKNVRIVKPLFNVKKKKLLEYLMARKVRWYEDISNQSEKYARNRVRKYIVEKGTVFEKDIHTQMKTANIEASKLRLELIKAISESTSINNYGVAKIDLDVFNSFSNQTKINLINYVVMIISGSTRTPRAESTQLIIKLLFQYKNFNKTLHGCVLAKYGNVLTVYYELGKNTLNQSIWDRFKYHKDLVTSNIDNISITYLNMNDYVKIKDKIDLQNLRNSVGTVYYKKILFTLPVIKILENLIAMPHISYYNDKIFEKDYFTFSPKFISRFTHFC